MDKTTIINIAAGSAVAASAIDSTIAKKRVKKLEKQVAANNKFQAIEFAGCSGMTALHVSSLVIGIRNHKSLSKKYDEHNERLLKMQQDIENLGKDYDELKAYNAKLDSITKEVVARLKDHNVDINEIRDKVEKLISEYGLSNEVYTLHNRVDAFESGLNSLYAKVYPPQSEK